MTGQPYADLLDLSLADVRALRIVASEVLKRKGSLHG